MAKRSKADFLNGIPELLILTTLSREPMYGYQLVKSIHDSTARQLEFAEGCIYPLLHRLEADGLLSGRKTQVKGRERIVYRVTAKGKRRTTATKSRWREVVDAVSLALEGDMDVAPSPVAG